MLLDEIAKHIDSNVTSLTMNENLFGNHYPDSPDTLVSVIDLGGFPPNRYTTQIREKTYEIKIRSLNYADGVDLGQKIMNLFHSKENFQLGSFFILGSRAYTELSYLYSDSKDRDEFSIELAFEFTN